MFPAAHLPAAGGRNSQESFSMASALNPISRPRPVAVIGASTDEQALGRQLLETMVRYGHHGKLSP